MKQTAVEFLIQELTEIGALNINGLHWSDKDDANSVIEKAKAIEKEQIVDARVNGVAEGIDIGGNPITEDISKNHQIYYNETYNK